MQGVSTMDKDNRPPLSIPETAQRLKASEQVVRRALLRGELKGFKIGRAWRVTPESVDRLLRGSTSEAA
jgi:excisionase family DNA binding protein